MLTCRRWEWSTIIWPPVFGARSWLSQDSVLRLNSGAKGNNLGRSMLRLAVLALLASLPGVSAHSQEGDPEGTVTLEATPRLVDPDYRGAVLLAAPVENNRHVGVIINRPTGRSLSSLFPEHAPSKLVHDPVYFGGPLLRQAIFAVVHIDHTPGPGSIRMMQELFLATQGTDVVHTDARPPNTARS